MDLNPTATLSRAEFLLMKDRMEARGQVLEASQHGTTFSHYHPPPPPAPQQQSHQHSSTMAPLNLPNQQPHYDPNRPPTADSSVQNVDRCRSLKERIYDRAVRPPTPMLSETVTKDVYTHEVPFPVKSVYEVERVAPQSKVISPSAKVAEGQQETLLMAAESALLVRGLEERLGVALQRIAGLEEDCAYQQTRADTANTKLLTTEQQVVQLAARNEELLKQLQAVREEAQLTVEAKSKENERTVQDAVLKANKTAKLAEDKMNHELTEAKKEIEELKKERGHMEVLLKELKEQMAQNAASLQASTQMTRQLTNELLAAKQQSSFVSTGYQQMEGKLRAALAENHSHNSELTVLRESAKELKEEKDRRKKAEYDLGVALDELTKLRPGAAEKKDLAKKCAALEKEVEGKSKEMMELKQQIELVRGQAATAFDHAHQFYQGSGAYGPAGPVNLEGSIRNPNLMGSSVFTDLMRQASEEERRALEEGRRWRERKGAVPTH